MATLFLDIRYALRQLTRNPGFTITAAISLALGIGATTAVFSVIYAALMDPYPYPGADRIVRLTVESKAGPGDWINLNGTEVQRLRQVPGVESVLAMGYAAMTLTGHDVPVNVNAIDLISTGFADLGVPPLLGRGIWPSDAPDGQDPQPVVVLAYKFWQKQFFSDPNVIGRKLQLDHSNYTIVGVAAPRFTWYAADVYRPLKLIQNPARLYIIDIRLRPGVSHAAADAALTPFLTQLAKETPNRFPRRFRVRVEGLNEWVTRGMAGTLYLLFAGVAVLLAIGCGNVSILLLARGTARLPELAVRMAVGARRGRIVRQLLTESIVLASIGVLLGVWMSYATLGALRALLPLHAFAPEVVIEMNRPVLLFSAALALATGVLFGLWPAMQLSSNRAGRAMEANGRRIAGSVHGRRTHNLLIAGQIALTLLLLAGAGSAAEGFMQLIHMRLGYDPHNVLSLEIPLHDNTYTTWQARAAYFEQLRAKVAETPGVTMTGISSNATPPRNGWYTGFEVLGKPPVEEQMASINFVSPGYFATLRIPLREGRLWNETENHAGAHVALINRELALRYFPQGGAIGHSLRLPAIEAGARSSILTPPNIAEAWLEIVGVVEDAKNDGLANPITPATFVPFTLRMSQGTQILVRSAGAPLALLETLRRQLASVNPDQQAYNVIEDLDSWISDQDEWQQEHLAAWIFGVFASLALVLAAVGLYSVVTYTVAQRRAEFGIRIALGAQPADVIGIVFASTLASVSGGILAGLALTLASSTLLSQWVKGNSHDPRILISGAAVLAIVAAIACAIPAWRACRADPMAALRCE